MSYHTLVVYRRVFSNVFLSWPAVQIVFHIDGKCMASPVKNKIDTTYSCKKKVHTQKNYLIKLFSKFLLQKLPFYKRMKMPSFIAT